MTLFLVPQKNAASSALERGIPRGFHELQRAVAAIAVAGWLAGAAAATSGVAPASQENRDSVQTKDGKTETGTIKSAHGGQCSGDCGDPGAGQHDHDGRHDVARS